MLGRIVLTLILWLAAAKRMIAGVHLVVRYATAFPLSATCFPDATSLETNPVIPAKAGAEDDRRSIHAALGKVGERGKDFRIGLRSFLAVAFTGMMTKLRWRCWPTSALPPAAHRDNGLDWSWPHAPGLPKPLIPLN